MGGLGRLLAEFVVAVGYGTLSSIVPLFNAEVFLAAARVSGAAAAWTSGVGVGVGQAIGKVALFCAVRHGSRGRLTAWVTRRSRRQVDEAERAEPGRWLAGWRRARARLLGLIDDPRWSVPVLALSGLVGVPPIYPMPVLLAPTRMKTGVFAAVCSVTMVARFTLLALIIDGALTVDWPRF